jgi:hypothetical protein
MFDACLVVWIGQQRLIIHKKFCFCEMLSGHLVLEVKVSNLVNFAFSQFICKLDIWSLKINEDHHK